MNAIPGFRYLAWLTALCITAFIAAGAFRFGLMTEPEQTDFLALLFFVGLGLASQSGLIAAPWSLSQDWAVRIVVAALMAPAAIFLGLAAWDGAQRFLAGNPISPLAWSIYLVGSVVYSLAYIELVWRWFHDEPKL